MDVLASEGLFLPAACGGRGSCGSCRCQVAKPVIAHNYKELPYLSSDERAAGIHLACQCKINSDMSVLLPQETLLACRLETRIASMQRSAGKFMLLSLDIDPGKEFLFAAGQYALLEPGIKDNKGLLIRRAYSFASDPHDHSQVRFLIALAPGGQMSEFLLSEAKVGDKIGMIGPFGSFNGFSGKNPEIWLAASSGIAPFMSLIHNQLARKNTSPRTLIFSAPTKEMMPCLDEVKNLCLPENCIQLILVETKPKNDHGTEVSLQAFLNDFLSKESSVEKMGFLLCANPGTIDSCINVLQRYGVPANQIRHDQFY